MISEDELLPPPPKKQVTEYDGDLLPPPPAKKNATSQSSTEPVQQPLAQPVQPSKQNGTANLPPITLGAESLNAGQTVTDATAQTTVSKPVGFETKEQRRQTIGQKSNEHSAARADAILNYNTYESNIKDPKVKELEVLHNRLREAEEGRGIGEDAQYLKAQIELLGSQAVEPKLSALDQFGQPISKKAPYKTYGEMYEATKKSQNLSTAQKETADKLQAELTPAIEAERKKENFQVDYTDENGNEYYKMNPMESFINGISGSIDVLDIGLQNISGNKPAALNAMKNKYVADNILFPKGTGDISATPSGALNAVSKLTEMGGGVVPLVAVGAAASSTGPLGVAAANALLFGAQDYGGTLYQAYSEEKSKNPDITDEEAMQLAESKAKFAGAKGAVLGGSMGLQGALGKSLFLNKAETSAFKTFMAEQSVMLPAFGTSTALQNLYEDKPVGEGVGQSMIDALIIGGMTHAVGAGMKMTTKLRGTFENAIAKNYGKLATTLNNAVEAGTMDATTAASIQQRAKAFDIVGKENPPKSEAKLVDLGIALNDVAQKSEEVKKANPLADTGELEAEAERINREIAETKGSPLSEKEQKEYEKLIEKRDKPATEGGEKPSLLQSEKDKIKHFEARIERAGKNEANSVAEGLGYDHAKHLLNDIEAKGLGKFERVQDVPKEVLEETSEMKKDEAIAAQQKKLGLPVTPETILSDEAQSILEKIQIKKLAPSDQIKTLTDELYKAYKALTQTRGNANRRFTREQIDATTKDLESKIEVLETVKALQDESGGLVTIDLAKEYAKTPEDAKRLVDKTKPFTRERQPQEVGETETIVSKPASGQVAETVGDAHLKVSADVKTALDNSRKKQVVSVDKDGNQIVDEVDFTKDDADVELDRLEALAARGKLTEQEFLSSFFGQATDTATFAEVKQALKSDAVGFIKKLRQSFEGGKVEQRPTTERGAEKSGSENNIGQEEKQAEEVVKPKTGINEQEISDVVGSLGKQNEQMAESILPKAEEVAPPTETPLSNTAEGVEKQYGTKNEVTDKLLEEMDLPPIVKETVKNNKETFDLVKSQVDNGGRSPLETAKAFLEQNENGGTEQLNDEQHFELDYGIAKNGVERDAVEAQITEVLSSGDKTKYTQLLQEKARLQDEAYTMIQAADRSGTVWGRTGQARKRTLGQDYSLQAIETRARAANAGYRLPENIEKELEKLATDLKTNTAKIGELEKAIKDIEEKRAIENIKETVVRNRKKSAGNAIRGKDLIAEGLDDLVTALGGKKMAIGDRSPSVSMALEKIGRGLIDEGIATIENVAQKVREYLEEKIPGKINFDDYEDGFADSIKIEETTDGKLKIPHALIREAVEAGNTEINGIVDYVKEKLGTDATDREIRDEITGYGKTSSPSKEDIEVTIRKQKRLGRAISQLEDIRAKKRPLKSGPQRDALDVEERAKMKEVREAMKDLPIDEATKAQHLKTALDAAKQHTKNRIEDLDREIKTKERTPKNNKPLEADAELLDLRARRDELQKQHDEIFDSGLTDEQKISNAIKATERSIAEYERRIRDKDFAPKDKAATPETPELKELREKRDAKKAEYEQLKKEKFPPKSAEEKATEAKLRRIENEIEETQRRIDENELETKKKESLAQSTPEIEQAQRALHAKRGALKELQEADGVVERKKLEVAKKSAAKREQVLLEKLRTGDYATAKKQPIQADKELSDARLRNQKLKNQIDQKVAALERANRTRLEKAIDFIPEAYRFAILSGYHVLGKLMGAGFEQALIFTPLRKGIQKAIGKIPGISSIAAKAPTEGDYSVKSLAENYVKFFAKETMESAYETLRTGKSRVDLINQDITGTDKSTAPKWSDFILHSHAAIKTLPKTAEYWSSLQSASEWAIKEGLDLTKPDTQKFLHELAYNNAVRNIFMAPNTATKAYNGALTIMNNLGIGGRALARFLKVDMPIIAVPTNIVNDVSSYVAGGAKAAWTLGYHGKGKPENLTPQQADHFMRSVGKQAVGAIGMAVAYTLYDNFGGFYHKGEKRKDDELHPGDMNVAGKKISHVFTHHPGFVAMQISADVERQIQAHKKAGKKDDTFNIYDAIINSVSAVARTIPFLGKSSDISDTKSPSGSAGHAAAKVATGFIPQGIKEVAKDLDTNEEGETVKRKAETILDELKLTMPVVREGVAEKKEKTKDERPKRPERPERPKR